MAQESKGMAVAQKQPHMNDDEDEVRDLQKQQPRSGGIYDKVRRQAERFASTWLGQYVIERADRALKMIEDTAKWSLPRDENACLPERPLPWTLFLWMILVLRLTRIWLSLGALMIGNGPVSPSDVIYFIQTRRRKLRAIRVHGLKVMRQRQQEAAMGSSTNYSQKFAFWWSRAICRPGVQRENSGRLFHIRGGVSEQKSNQNQSQAGQRQPIAKRPRDEDCSIDHNLTIEEMLAKYANENSEDDVDFVPDAEDEENDDDSDSSNDSSNTDSSAETSASELEKHDEHNEKEEKAEVKAKAEPATDLGHNEPITRNGNDHKKPLQAQSSDLAVQSISQQLLPKEDQWKASPGHVSAASTRLYGTSNTVAAVTTEHDTDSNHDNDNDDDKDNDNDHDSNNDDSHSDNDNDNDNEDNETDSSTSASTSKSNCTVHSAQSYQSYQDIEKQRNEAPNDGNVSRRSTTQLIVPSNYPNVMTPTVETLTPATSSEDIFYSPIGSPSSFNALNNCFGPGSTQKSASDKSYLKIAFSSPIPGAEVQAQTEKTPASDFDSIFMKPYAQPDQPQSQPKSQNPHQQQRNQNQRYRGRNRR